MEIRAQTARCGHVSTGCKHDQKVSAYNRIQMQTPHGAEGVSVVDACLCDQSARRILPAEHALPTTYGRLLKCTSECEAACTRCVRAALLRTFSGSRFRPRSSTMFLCYAEHGIAVRRWRSLRTNGMLFERARETHEPHQQPNRTNTQTCQQQQPVVY